ncbi:hypothetical protein EG328_011729 [Venturia inaequalis]|uniref:Uncharacterized protein n=1 Tax=Venturia inaequalis TaxID=5025 RepID=A0A8H3V6Q1_VENIN|nr:hypothetical protein EG328_011729 [Venturia inaequalis]
MYALKQLLVLALAGADKMGIRMDDMMFQQRKMRVLMRVDSFTMEEQEAER